VFLHANIAAPQKNEANRIRTERCNDFGGGGFQTASIRAASARPAAARAAKRRRPFVGSAAFLIWLRGLATDCAETENSSNSQSFSLSYWSSACSRSKES
jgi:hypothetical protein